MKNRGILLAVSLGCILTLIVPAAVPHLVFAQAGCYGARGQLIPCPPAPENDDGGKKKIPTPTRQRVFPSATPSQTPQSKLTPTATPTKPILGFSVVGTPPLPTSEAVPDMLYGPLNNMPAWLFGLLVPAVLVLLGWFALSQLRRGGSPGDRLVPAVQKPGENRFVDPKDGFQPGEERGALNAYSPPPDPELGGTMNNNETTVNNNETTMNNNEDGGSLTTNNE